MGDILVMMSQKSICGREPQSNPNGEKLTRYKPSAKVPLLNLNRVRSAKVPLLMSIFHQSAHYNEKTQNTINVPRQEGVDEQIWLITTLLPVH